MIAAAERRAIVPVGTELRVLAWGGVMLIASGVGIYIYKHLDQIGPLAISIALGVIAMACYLWVALKSRAPLDDYVVLLGALLISADVGFIEKQWSLLGSEWQRHFLLLAIAHAAAAYWFESRSVLSLSLASLATWWGIEQHEIFNTNVDFAVRAFACAGVIAVWRVVNHHRAFAPVFDQFAINIAFWGALVLTWNHDWRFAGLLITILLAAAVLGWGFRQKRELFVVYAFVYTIIALDFVIVDAIHDEVISVFYLLVSSVAAIVALLVIHVRFQKRVAVA